MDLFKILDGTPEPPIVSLSTSENMSGDYWLPVPMCEYQKELTDQVVSLHYSDILKYFETDDKEQVLLDSLEVLYLNSQLVATHPYLLIDHYMPKNLATKDTPWNLCETSGKFQVLKDVITLLEDRKINVAIVGRSGKLLDLLEALLLGSRCHINKLHGTNLKLPAKYQSTKKEPKSKELTVHIVPSDVADFSTKLRFDMIIAVDITPTTQFLESLRKNPRTPILRLVSTNSIDHIALYFRQFHDRGTKDYLVDVTAAIVVLRDQVGVLPPDLRPIYSKSLTYLKDWLLDFSFMPWPLPEMSNIRKYDARDVERSLLTEVHYDEREKVVKRKTYYETKRLNQDYTSNPLRDVSFGILSVNSNYSDSLTHRLIQDFNNVHAELQLKQDELKHLIFFEGNKKEFTHLDQTKIEDEIEGYKSRIEAASKQSDELTTQIEEKKQMINEQEERVTELSKYEKLNKIKELKGRIAREEQRKQRSVTEIDYMKKEITNAENSVLESEKEITDLKTQIGANEQKLDDYWLSYQKKTIDDLELRELTNRITDLKMSIEESLTKLQNSKVRTDTRRNSPSVK